MVDRSFLSWSHKYSLQNIQHHTTHSAINVRVHSTSVKHSFECNVMGIENFPQGRLLHFLCMVIKWARMSLILQGPPEMSFKSRV